MKKRIFLSFFIAFVGFIFVFGGLKVKAADSITLTVNKSNYLVGEKACFNIYILDNSLIDRSTTTTNVVFYSSGPNNRGCTNGCPQSITSSFFGITFCTNNFVSEDVGNWQAYITYNGFKSSAVNYTVNSQQDITQQSLQTNNRNSISFTANDLTDLLVFP
ncbi:MAG: hypothetical protein ACP5QN_01530, partial [Minisyncoccia bacterium]